LGPAFGTERPIRYDAGERPIFRRGVCRLSGLTGRRGIDGTTESISAEVQPQELAGSGEGNRFMDGTMSVSRRRFFGLAAAGLGLSATPLCWAAPSVADRLAPIRADHPLLPALKLAGDALQATERMEGYEATFIKNELIGRKLMSTQMFVKVRHAPFSVYMKFVTPHEGREVIYVEGQNDGKMLAHETGFASLVGTVTLLPTERRAMEENRHPITAFGLRNLAEGVFSKLLEDTKGDVATVNLFPQSKIGDIACKTIEVHYAKPTQNRPYQTARLYIEQATSLPIRIQNYAFAQRRNEQPALVEDYFYTAVKSNVVLVAQDFDVNNPRYGY